MKSPHPDLCPQNLSCRTRDKPITETEIQAFHQKVTVVEYQVCPNLHKVGVFGITDRDHSVDLLDELLLLVVIKLHVPLSQPGLPRSVLDQDEADLGWEKDMGEG